MKTLTSSAKPTPTPHVRSSTREPVALRQKILRNASVVFAKYGYEGGSIEKITRAAKTHDRMIYYYFGSKEKLYIEVLENVYRDMSEAEAALALDVTQPLKSLLAIVDFVWTYYRAHPAFIALLNTENLRKGRHIKKSKKAHDYAFTAMSLLDTVLKNGAKARLFRKDVSARDVYLLIASMGYFYQSNRYTLSAFLSENTQSTNALNDWHAFMRETVLQTVKNQTKDATARRKSS